MDIPRLIRKKRDGQALSREEILDFIDCYTRGGIPDYQCSALLMAIYFRGLDPRETADLTEAMIRSGQVLDLSEFPQRSEEHTSELQSPCNLVCRLLLEKKKKHNKL